MSELRHRVLRVFSSVFPSLSPDQLRLASAETVPEWDSLASATLVAVLEEEFDINIDLGELPELQSFDAVLDYLSKGERSGAMQN